MFFLIYLLALTAVFLLIKNILIKEKKLLSASGDNHQNFSSKQNVPLTGGIFIFLSLSYFLFQNLINIDLYVFLLLILILGLFADLKLIKSAKKRLFYQFLIVLIFVIYKDIEISNTRIYLLDYLLQYEVLSYFFICFCVLIIMNGSNFIDGLNTLNLGYFLSICLIILYLSFINEISINDIPMKFVIIIIIFSYIFNINNNFFLGDSGSYLLGGFFSLYLINLYELNSHISPFFIVLLLWYPSYETLFSIIRKKILKRSSMRPDTNHLHQLIFFMIRKDYFKKTYLANIISANLINLYNLIIFSISLNFITQSQIQIILIILNLIVYTVTYFRLFVYRFNKI